MIKHAWSLVFFTVLGQMGAGLYLVHKLVLSYGRFFNSGIQLNSKRLLMISVVISVIAFIISFSHLGNPRNVIFALANIKNSWLSREILFLAVFIGIMAIEIILKKWLSNSNTRDLVVSSIGIFV